MTNVLFFEDEYDILEEYVGWMNRRIFKNKLKISVLNKTNVNTDFTQLLTDYDKIFVDIGLAKNSLDDGYAIVNKFRLINPCIGKKVFVITADKEIADGKKNGELAGITILKKPINRIDFIKAIKDA